MGMVRVMVMVSARVMCRSAWRVMACACVGNGQGKVEDEAKGQGLVKAW